jgi:hypothetical protein
MIRIRITKTQTKDTNPRKKSTGSMPALSSIRATILTAIDPTPKVRTNLAPKAE